jgi:hypothetical protein
MFIIMIIDEEDDPRDGWSMAKDATLGGSRGMGELVSRGHTLYIIRVELAALPPLP